MSKRPDASKNKAYKSDIIIVKVDFLFAETTQQIILWNRYAMYWVVLDDVL